MRALIFVTVLLGGCEDEFVHTMRGGDAGVPIMESDGSTPGGDASSGADLAQPEPTGPCDVDFHFQPAMGQTVSVVEVRGEWNGFQPGLQLMPDGAGGFTGKQSLMPGLVAYKLVIDGNWELDPGA